MNLQHLPPGSLMLSAFWYCSSRKFQACYALILPILKRCSPTLTYFSNGFVFDATFMGYALQPIRVDKLSLIFGYIFHIAAFLSGLFALKVEDPIQHLSGMVYAGAAIAAAFCGDLISLFIFWELTAITSVFLIWAARTESATRTGVRYLVVQVASGVILLAGTLLHYQETGSLAFDAFMQADGSMTYGAWWIFAGIGIKAAFPCLHNWLQDAYPKATYSGTVYLSAFTTKLAIYALARGFAGNELLIPIGCVMTAFPIFFAVIENDLRKVLAYSLNNQLGFMVVGIGIGTELAINGACAHAFAHIIYKGLLFMAMGAVLYTSWYDQGIRAWRSSSNHAVDNSLLHHRGDVDFGIPFLSGFAAKSLIASAAGYEGMVVVTFVLLFASAGVMEHSGIKIPFFAFFAHDSGKRPKEAPWNMLAAMAIASALCIGIGVYPRALYDLLPYATDYNAYDVTHVVTQLELLLFAALAFALLLKFGAYPAEVKSINLDFDWFYRKVIPNFLQSTISLLKDIGNAATAPIKARFDGTGDKIMSMWGLDGKAPQAGAESGASALWAALILCLFLIMFYL